LPVVSREIWERRVDYWVVGTNGTFIYYNGTTWEETDLGADVDLRSISAYGSYACGDDGAVYKSPFGSNWTNLGYSNISPFNDIDGLSTDEIFAANADSLMQWDGVEWTGLASPGNELVSVAAAASDRVWVVARDAGGFDNYVWMWNGSTFQFRGQSSMDRFNSIWCDNAGDTVMVATDNGYVHRWPPGSWDWLEADPQRRDLYDLWGTSAHDVFAAGDNGAVTRFDGSAWRAEKAGVSANLNAVCYVNDNEKWAVGDGGVVIRYNGSDWIAYKRALYTVDLISVWGHATDDVWFGGEDGYLLKFVP
jgi:photosystem II stability/assembly factor-like uncharacterized protein